MLKKRVSLTPEESFCACHHDHRPEVQCWARGRNAVEKEWRY